MGLFSHLALYVVFYLELISKIFSFTSPAMKTTAYENSLTLLFTKRCKNLYPNVVLREFKWHNIANERNC